MSKLETDERQAWQLADAVRGASGRGTSTAATISAKVLVADTLEGRANFYDRWANVRIQRKEDGGPLLNKAQVDCSEALKLRREIVQTVPSTENQMRLAACCRQLGDVKLRVAEIWGAVGNEVHIDKSVLDKEVLKYFGEAVKVLEERLGNFSSVEFQFQLAMTQYRFAYALTKLRDFPTAHEYYEKSRAIMQHLAEADDRDVRTWTSLFSICNDEGRCCESMGNRIDAERVFENGRKMAEAKYPQYANMFEDKLNEVRKAGEHIPATKPAETRPTFSAAEPPPWTDQASQITMTT